MELQFTLHKIDKYFNKLYKKNFFYFLFTTL